MQSVNIFLSSGGVCFCRQLPRSWLARRLLAGDRRQCEDTQVKSTADDDKIKPAASAISWQKEEEDRCEEGECPEDRLQLGPERIPRRGRFTDFCWKENVSQFNGQSELTSVDIDCQNSLSLTLSTECVHIDVVIGHLNGFIKLQSRRRSGLGVREWSCFIQIAIVLWFVA